VNDTATLTDLLPEIDREFLEEKGYSYTAISAGGELHVVLRDYEFPPVYAPRTADLLIILPAGYPNANPDMYWTYPDVKLVNGQWPLNSEHHQTYGSRSWQRWSRHYQGKWRAGVDSLRTYLAVVRKEIAKGI
jgi:hypothetical protein